jgi:hypothetical protein
LRLAAFWSTSLRRRLFFSTELVFAISDFPLLAAVTGGRGS